MAYYRMSADQAARLIRPHLPDEAIQRGIPEQHAAFIAQAVLVQTNGAIDLFVSQVYAGIGWLRDNPEPGALPLITATGGYFYGSDPTRVRIGMRPRMRSLHTQLRRHDRGTVQPYADLVLGPIDQREADALRQDFANALAAVGRHI